MSTLRETNIGFGGTDSSETNIQPYPPQDSINLDPILEALQKNKKTALQEAKEDVDSVSEKDISEIIQEVENDVVNAAITTTVMKHTIPKGTNDMTIDEDPGLKRALDDSKKIVENFRDKVANYPKHMSYEGSMVMCVMIALGGGKETCVSLSALPKVDQKLIKSSLSEKWVSFRIRVSLDSEKDFVIRIEHDREDGGSDSKTFSLFNTVAHPRPEDVQDINQVPIEEKGNTLKFGGGAMNFDKQRLADLAALPSQKEERVPEAVIRSTNKNAYEIRSDILKMALDFSMRGNDYVAPEKVLDIAKKFYSFVENKR